MDASVNGSDPRTYKKVQDDNNTTSSNNYQNELNINASPLNDAGTTNTQQTNLSTSPSYSLSSTTNKFESINRPSNDHGKTS